MVSDEETTISVYLVVVIANFTGGSIRARSVSCRKVCSSEQVLSIAETVVDAILFPT